MINGAKTQKEPEDKETTEEEDFEKNPDLEDPRLYSPLQEPDRPSPVERVAEENAEEGSDASSD